MAKFIMREINETLQSNGNDKDIKPLKVALWGDTNIEAMTVNAIATIIHKI